MRAYALSIIASAGLFATVATSVAAAPKVTSNKEMAAIFRQDQDARKAANIDWSQVNTEDAGRRARTKQLMNSGQLRSADDYYHAAFVFQHGDGARDYLLAHALAMAAMKLGRPDASWIAAATLDRYLQEIGQKQVFGTQYSTADAGPWTMGPYDRDLLPDSLRSTLGVPVFSEQTKQLQQLNTRAKP
jgi:hypothetical protein